MKLLVVEDNALNRDMISRLLALEGFEVIAAEDGAEGIALAIAHKPDVILMDMSLPIVDGWEATRRLKANPDTSHIAIIALTAHAMVGDREKAMDAGCDDYDTKPIDVDRLVEKIRALEPATRGGTAP